MGLKRCTRCGEWKPATEKYFYKTRSRGRERNQFGELFLRSRCIPCRREEMRESAKQKKRPDGDAERKAKMQKARRRAYRRLAKINEEGFKLLYAEELLREGIRLEHYHGPINRRGDEDRSGDHRRTS